MPARGRFLLDSNIVIALLQGDDVVLSNLDRAPEVFIPAVVLGELFFGAAKSARPSENTEKVERFAANRYIVPCDLDVAREYGRLKQRLQEKGCATNIGVRSKKDSLGPDGFVSRNIAAAGEGAALLLHLCRQISEFHNASRRNILSKLRKDIRYNK